MGYRWQPDHVPQARERVAEEINRNEQERDAYKTFYTRLTEYQPKPTSTAKTAGQSMFRNRAMRSQLKAIRDVYRETVMQVPHISEEKSFKESLTAEFQASVAELFLTGD